jgi:hypothetical protein
MKCGGKFTEKVGRRQKVESARQTAGGMHAKFGVRPAICAILERAPFNKTFSFVPTALNPMPTSPLPEQIELNRDRMWRRDEELRIESAVDAERFIEDVGFANTLTDARRAGPSFRHRGVRAAGC